MRIIEIIFLSLGVFFFFAGILMVFLFFVWPRIRAFFLPKTKEIHFSLLVEFWIFVGLVTKQLPRRSSFKKIVSFIEQKTGTKGRSSNLTKSDHNDSKA